jgi:periplasmic protein TonB
MTKPRHTHSRTSRAPGVKALITAASLAATLGGWATLTHTQPEAADSPSELPVSALMSPRSPADLTLEPLLLPTIVPLPPPPKIVIDRPPAISAALLSAQAPQLARPAAQQPAPQAPAPAAAQPAAIEPVPATPPLRVVSAPPQPVARTRSSR